MIMWLLVLIFHCRALKSLQYTCPLLTNNTNMVSLKGIVNVICLLRMQKLTFYFILFFFFFTSMWLKSDAKLSVYINNVGLWKKRYYYTLVKLEKLWTIRLSGLLIKSWKKKKTAVQHKKLLFFYRWQYILMCQLLAKFYGLLILCQFQEFGCLYT